MDKIGDLLVSSTVITALVSVAFNVMFIILFDIEYLIGGLVFTLSSFSLGAGSIVFFFLRLIIFLIKEEV